MGRIPFGFKNGAALHNNRFTTTQVNNNSINVGIPLAHPIPPS